MKNKRRSIAIVILVSAFLISCAGQAPGVDTGTPAGEPAAFTVGMLGQGAPTSSSYVNTKAVVEAAGGRLVTEGHNSTPESRIAAFERLIAAGCDGIIVIPTSDTALPFIVEMCEEAGVYWVISMRSIHDIRIRQQVEASPYFVGSVMENDEAVGYDIMCVLGEQGAKKVAVLSISTLDTTGAARERGMNFAAEEYDMDVVAIIRNSRRSEDTSTTVESLMNAYPDLDAVFRVATYGAGASTAAMNAIWDAGKAGQIHYATSDIEQGMDVFFDRGMVSVATGGHIPFDSSLAAALLVNTLMGTPLKEDGPVTLHINPIMFRSGDEMREYYKAVEDGAALFSEETAKQKLLKWNNPNLTVQSFQELIDAYSTNIILEWKYAS